MAQSGGLRFNGLNLMMDEPDPTYGYRIYVVAGNTEIGDPEVVISNVQSQLQDGDLQRVDRYGNRTATLDVRIDAPGAAAPGAAVAYGQQALELAARFDGWAELEWTSPMAGAETSVMEMTSASVGKTLDTLREMNAATRILKVTIGARPFVRAVSRDVFSAPAVVGATTTTVDNGSSTTGWSLLSTAPATETNLIDPDAWTAGSNATKSGANTSASTVRFDQVAGGTFYGQSNSMPVTVGSSYRVRATIDPAGTSARGIDYAWLNSSNVEISRTTVQWGGAITSSFVTTAAPSGAVSLRILPFGVFSSGGSLLTWIVISQVSVVSTNPGAHPDVYWDGNTTDTTAVNYAWTATVNGSTSTATWSAPTLAVVSGAVTGTVYGRASASIRRNNTGITSTAMATLSYIRIRGTATAATDGQITIADNGGAALTPDSYSYNTTTGAYDILIKRPAGFTNLDVTYTSTNGTISTTSGVFVGVDQIDITDNPYSSGKVQTRQITIGGSQRTELSLSILGLDAAGSTPVALGEQVLVHTAAKGSDGRAKFLDARAAVGTVGTPTADTTAVSGVYNTLATTTTPLNFTFPTTALLPGNYLVVARLMPTTTGNKVISFRGYVDPSVGDNVYDPPGGTAWKTTPLTVATSGWPAITNGSWAMLPLGLLRLPPADLQDPGATLTIQIAADTASAVRLDDMFLLNADIGQATLVNTTISGGSYSAVRLDAATVDDPDPSVWVGVANGHMLTDPSRLQAFEQHRAAPGLLQASTVTPGCATTRLSGSFYRRNGHDMAPAA